MAQNKVSAVLEQAVVDGPLNEADAQSAKLPFLISLTDKERESLPRFGAYSITFFYPQGKFYNTRVFYVPAEEISFKYK